MPDKAFEIICIDDKWFYYDAGENLIGPFIDYDHASDMLGEYTYELNELGW